MEHLGDENATGGVLGEPLDDCHDGELVIKLLEHEFVEVRKVPSIVVKQQTL